MQLTFIYKMNYAGFIWKFFLLNLLGSLKFNVCENVQVTQRAKVFPREVKFDVLHFGSIDLTKLCFRNNLYAWNKEIFDLLEKRGKNNHDRQVEWICCFCGEEYDEEGVER